jgi:hypothetical protein
MIKRLVLVIVALAFMANFGSAQSMGETLKFGPKIGLNLANVYDSEGEEFENENIRKNTLCFLGGFDVNYSRFVI